ncbi:hypothetical protein C0995_003438, partial [Termitomyces sp. Mi166
IAGLVPATPKSYNKAELLQEALCSANGAILGMEYGLYSLPNMAGLVVTTDAALQMTRFLPGHVIWAS